MPKDKKQSSAPRFQPPCRLVLAEVGGLAALMAVVAFSAVVVKELTHGRNGQGTMPLVAMTEPVHAVEYADDFLQLDGQFVVMDPLVPGGTSETVEFSDPAPGAAEQEPAAEPEQFWDASVRWFNGRPIRAARTITMVVTAYSPDSRSCGDSADGITASLHRVETNAFRLAAADSKVLPLGSMITVPGYDSSNVIPVLDRGGAIKGTRLDVLFPTHEQARKWGVRKVPVTVWEYADGAGRPNWRNIRDSK